MLAVDNSFINRIVTQVDPDGLRLAVLFMGLQRVVTPTESGQLVPTKWRGNIAFVIAIYLYGSSLQGPGIAVRFSDIGCVK
jgi:hypothetical protein